MLRAFSCAAPVHSSREGTTPVEGDLSSGILLECFLARADEPALKLNPVGSSSMMGFPSSRPEWPIASWATISVIISRIPNGDKHRFVNYDFPFPKPDEPRLNSIETRERNWVKAPFRDVQATSAADNHKNIIVDCGSKAKLG